MPTAICQKCGTTLRFEGLAALCPKCGTVLRIAAPPPEAGAPARQQDREAVQRTRASSSRRRQAPDLSELDTGDPEVFEPDEAPTHHGGLASLDPRLIKGFAVAMVLVLLFGLYVAFRPASSEVTVITPSPAPAPTAPPAPVAPVAPPPPPPVVNIIQPVVATTSTAPAATEPAWMALKPKLPVLKAKPFTDAVVEQAIKKSAGYLKSQFADGQLRGVGDSDLASGQNALCVYALLQAGLAIDDPQLSVSDSFMQGLLDRLKQYPMEQSFTTYSRSLRASALALGGRDTDGDQLNKDYEFLLKSERGGAYTYTMPAPNATVDPNFWDNSNCQYGVLGVWAAVLTGVQAPDRYWNDVEQHWLNCQLSDGGWGYSPGDISSTAQMTCAGITTLCVTAEQLELIASKGKKDARPKMSAAIARGLKFLGTGNNILDFKGGHEGYILYGIERAALATGYRWFGDHDWYRELGAIEIQKQGSDGVYGGADGPNVGTAFRLLFLSRGRQPIFMDKLRFDGDWNDRPRNVAKLTQFASAQLEKPFAWGVADLRRDWWDWLECPLLFITTDMAPSFSDEDCAKLRAYTDAGGLIFLHNEYGAKDVDAFAISLAKRVYPEYPLNKVAPDDPIYNCDFPIKEKPELWSVGNGTRTFMIFSPKDVTQDWVRYRPKDARSDPNLQLAINLFVTAAGKTDFRNRLSSPYEPEPDFAAEGTLPIQQITYRGPWNAEPKAWERFSRWFQNQTSIKLEVEPTPLTSVSPKVGPVAVLTGNSMVNFSGMDFHALQQFVFKGGVLFIDSTGGNKAFAASVRDSLIPTAFPGVEPASLTASDAILAGTGPCMDRLPKPHLRNYASMLLNGVAPTIEYAQVGKGAVIISDLDVTTGLLDSGTYGIYGYTPAYCQSLMKNVILWALSRYSRL